MDQKMQHNPYHSHFSPPVQRVQEINSTAAPKRAPSLLLQAYVKIIFQFSFFLSFFFFKRSGIEVYNQNSVFILTIVIGSIKAS